MKKKITDRIRARRTRKWVKINLRRKCKNTEIDLPEMFSSVCFLNSSEMRKEYR